MQIARPEIRAAQVPLTKAEFKYFLRRGSGRAILCLQKHDPEPYKKIILDACLEDTRYDSQCEDSRVPYLMEAMSLAGGIDAYRKIILDQLTIPPLQTPEELPYEEIVKETQLVGFALQFAKHGDVRARDLLYEGFAANPEYEEQYGSGRSLAILELGGMDGLTFVLTQYGRAARQNPEFFTDFWCTWDVSNLLGKERVEQHVQLLCRHSKDIDLLVKRGELKFGKALKKRRRTLKLPYEKLVSMIEARRPYPMSIPFWGRRSSKAQLRRAARDLVLQTDPELIRGYLYVFRDVKFPLSIKHVLKLVLHERDDVRQCAVEALRHFIDSRIRVLALDFLQNPVLRISAVRLFALNYQLGDAERIVRVAREIDDFDEVHHLSYSILDVYKKNHVSESFKPLLMMYEHNPCSNCRSSIAELIKDQQLKQDWLIEEMQFDCNEDVRQQARELSGV
jgi:hypothetical protein